MEKAHIEKKRSINGVELPLEFIMRTSVKSRDISRMIPHYHDYAELLYGIDCDVTAMISGENVRFGSGDLLLIKPDAAHDFIHMLDMNKYICIKFLPEIIYYPKDPEYDMKFVTPLLNNISLLFRLFPAAEVGVSPVPEAMEKIATEWEKKEYGYELAVKSALIGIFTWMIRNDGMHTGYGVKAPAAVASLEGIRMIRRSMDYIDENYASVTEGEAAASVNLSCGYYSRLFKTVTGKNFNEYLNSVRVNRAEKLLLSTDLSVTEIGFSTSSHLIVNFKKLKNHTPKQYRLLWFRKTSALT